MLLHTNRIDKNETSQPLLMQLKSYFRKAECQRTGRAIDGHELESPHTRKHFIFIQKRKILDSDTFNKKSEGKNFLFLFVYHSLLFIL